MTDETDEIKMDKYETVLKNGMVFLKECKYTRAIPVEDFAKEILNKHFSLETKQLPTNCVRYVKKKGLEIYYIHIPEDFYNLNDNHKIYAVRIPHTILTFSFTEDTTNLSGDITISWTHDEVLDLSSATFFVPPLQNVHSGYEHRTGSSMCINYPPSRITKQNEYVESFLKEFFTASFNTDLHNYIKKIAKVSQEQRVLLKAGAKPHDVLKVWWTTKNEDGTEQNHLNNGTRKVGHLGEVDRGDS